MAIHQGEYQKLKKELELKNIQLVAVSKSQSVDDIRSLYELGQRDFGENYVQELLEKQKSLPGDIRWHFIGHLQSNKVKSIAPFVQLIQSVDSLKLLETINKEAVKQGRIIHCLAQVHIAQEETKFGMNESELKEFFNRVSGELKNVSMTGLMGIASLDSNADRVRKEFSNLKELANRYQPGGIVSMGMSGDYKIAIDEGSTMLRIGSLVFGERQ